MMGLELQKAKGFDMLTLAAASSKTELKLMKTKQRMQQSIILREREECLEQLRNIQKIQQEIKKYVDIANQHGIHPKDVDEALLQKTMQDKLLEEEALELSQKSEV